VNQSICNLGIFFAFLGIISCLVPFFDYYLYFNMNDKSNTWVTNHQNIYHFLYWVSNMAVLFLHWIFNTRYITSSFRLPLLLEHAQQYCEVLQMVVK